MKQIKPVILSILMTLGAFSLIIYSSCKKDACKGVVCKNKGTCSGGNCSCPTGFSGNRCELSTIVFKNNTYTPVSITVNGAAYTIAKDSSLLVTDTAGKIATVAAATSGKTATGAVIGYTVNWSLKDTFPTNGTKFMQPLDVDPIDPANNKDEIYYLEVVNNNDSLAATQIVVIDLYTSERINLDMNIPNNGKAYGIGYFSSDLNTALQANNFNESNFIFKGIASDRIYILPVTLNQKYTFTIK